MARAPVNGSVAFTYMSHTQNAQLPLLQLHYPLPACTHSQCARQTVHTLFPGYCLWSCFLLSRPPASAIHITTHFGRTTSSLRPTSNAQKVLGEYSLIGTNWSFHSPLHICSIIHSYCKYLLSIMYHICSSCWEYSVEQNWILFLLSESSECLRGKESYSNEYKITLREGRAHWLSTFNKMIYRGLKLMFLCRLLNSCKIQWENKDLNFHRAFT